MATQTHDGGATRSPPLVLLVDADALDALSTEAFLNDLGMPDVRRARSVEQAMSLMDDTQFGLALVDCDLPHEAGFGLAQRLCAANVPIVVTAGSGEVPLPYRFAKASILRKPFAFRDLERAVRIS